MPRSSNVNFNQYNSMDYYSLAPFLWSYSVHSSSSYIRTPHAYATQVWKTEWRRTDDMDHKKGQVWATTYEWFGCDFHYFQTPNKTSVVFALQFQVTAPLPCQWRQQIRKPIYDQIRPAKSAVFIFQFCNPTARLFLVIWMWYWFYYDIISRWFYRCPLTEEW